MTARSAIPDRRSMAPPDFSSLSCAAARRRVAQLVALGLPEGTVAVIVGWSTSDVRRALSKS
jgi:hypothetical protein